ncbi:MAG: hypothetical protein WCP57_03275 [Bacteroidota bacterium]
MDKKIIISAILSFFIITQSWAQLSYDNESIMYSMYQYNGTARSIGVGSAFCSVGPDAGGISINPAIVATYRSSEVSGSIGLLNLRGETNFLNKYNNTDNRIRFIGNNLSMVFATSLGGNKPHEKITGKSDILKGFALGFSASRIADFNSQSYFEGINDTNSLVDAYRVFLNQENIAPGNITFDNYSLYPEMIMAYQSQLINYDPLRDIYTSSMIGIYSKKQTGTIRTNGGITDLSLQLGFNLWDKLFVGASVGMPYLTYSKDYLYTEEDYKDSIAGFKKFEYNAITKTEGVGFNGKFGLVYKPIKYFSIGASISTPTYFSLRDKYSYTMSHQTDSSLYNTESPIGAFDYSYRQPFRFNAGISGFFDKYGFISIDYELVNYTKNEFNFGNQNRDFNNYVNDTLINSKYRISHNIRAGIELAYKVWRIRGGYSIALSPFKPNVAVGDANLARQTFSAGAGYRGKRISIDIAWVRSVQKNYFSPYYSYYSYGEDAVITKNIKDNIVLTFGFKLRAS